MLKLVRLEKDREIYTRDVGWAVFSLGLVTKRRHGHVRYVWVEFSHDPDRPPREIEQESAIVLLYKEREYTLDGTPRPCG